MIPITINEKKYMIKSCDELTTKEFFEINKIENLDLLKYISWATKEDYSKVFHARISESVIKQIGSLKDDLPLPKKVIGIPVEINIIDTIGQRFMIETSNKKESDLLIFVCAVALSKSEDYTVIEQYENRLLNALYTEVIPAAQFFFIHLQNGRNLGISSFRKTLLLIKIKASRYLQGWISLINTLITLKS